MNKVILCFCCALFLMGNASAEENNLLTNPSFEIDKDANGIPDGWEFDVKAWTGSKGEINWKKGSGRSGDYSVNISITNDVGSMGVRSLIIPVKPNTTYRVSGWLKSEFSEWKKERSAYFSLNGYKDGKFVKENGYTNAVQLSSEWKEYAVEFSTGTSFDGLTISANLFGSGSIWIDDFSCVEKVEAKP